MLTLLSTILSWDDFEREKAGLQRVGVQGGAKSTANEKGKKKDRRGERSAEEEAAMNEVCFDLSVVVKLIHGSKSPSLTFLSNSSSKKPPKGNPPLPDHTIQTSHLLSNHRPQDALLPSPHQSRVDPVHLIPDREHTRLARIPAWSQHQDYPSCRGNPVIHWLRRCHEIGAHRIAMRPGI